MRGLIVSVWICVGACQPKIERFDPWDGGYSCRSCTRAPHNGRQGCPEILGEQFDCEGHCHISEGVLIDWDGGVPHSGDHLQSVPSWGEHLGHPVDREVWVQNLECGGIVLLYDCFPPESDAGPDGGLDASPDGGPDLDAGADAGPDPCEPELEQILRPALQGERGPDREARPGLRVLLTPDPLLEPSSSTPTFAAVSWTWVEDFSETELTLENVGCFIDQHEGNGRVDCPPPE